MRKSITAILAAAAILIACGSARAASTSIWSQYGAETFFGGSLENVSIRSDGTLRLGLENKLIMESVEPYIWSLATDSRGNRYAGSGNKAVLYRLGKDGKSQELAMLPGIGITALAVDKRDTIYAGVFPTGEIFTIDAKGERKQFVQLPARYIWALRLDGQGNLLAATGSPGGIYRISPNGETAALVRSQERHVLCMDLDEKGNIYAGTSPNGLVLRFDAKDKKYTVLYDLDEAEAYKLIYTGNGEMLIAANSDQTPSAAPASNGKGAQPGPDSAAQGDTPISFPVPYSTPQDGAAPTPSVIYRLKTDGDIKKLFSLPDPFILSLFRIDENHLLAGTGNRGNVYMLSLDSGESELLQLPVKQVLNIMGDRETQVYSTGNPGAVYTFKLTHNATGTYVSEVNDTYGNATWGSLRADADIPENTRLELSTRTGNTEDPKDGTWSEWSKPATSLPAQVESPSGRFIQYRANLFATDTRQTPVLREVNIAYLTANQPPRIGELKVSPTPQKRQPPAAGDSAGPGPAPRIPSAAQSQNAPDAQGINYVVGSVTARQEMTLNWKASDPDGDILRYSLFFRRLPSNTWTLINDKIYPSEFRWPTESVPDGKYELKLVASDITDNPPERARETDKVSERFIVDNSRPSVGASSSISVKDIVSISGTASDPTSIIAALEYSLDNLEWNVLFPSDRIFDSQTEYFRFDLEKLGPGTHNVIVRARDLVGNTGSISVQFATK